MDFRSKLVFQSPTLREIFGVGGSFLVGGYLLLSLLLVGASLLINVTAAIAALVMIFLGFVGLALTLWLKQGEIVLEMDGVVEYYPLNRVRKFRYDQIFEVKRGTHADQTLIRYYPLQADGQINYQRYKGTNLMGLKDNEKLRFELAQRMAALPPEFTNPLIPSRRQVVLIVLLLILVLLALVPFVWLYLR